MRLKWCTLSSLVYHLGKCGRGITSLLKSFSSITFAAQQQQQHRVFFFSGVKFIWQWSRPLGHICFPAKVSAQIQVKRLVNTHNTVSLKLFGGAYEKTQLASGACQSAVSTFWPQRTATLFLLETLLVAASETAVSQQSVSRGTLRQTKAATLFQQCI